MIQRTAVCVCVFGCFYLCGWEWVYLQACCCCWSSSSAICPTSLHSHSPTQSRPASAGAERGRPSLSHLSSLRSTEAKHLFSSSAPATLSVEQITPGDAAEILERVLEGCNAGEGWERCATRCQMLGQQTAEGHLYCEVSVAAAAPRIQLKLSDSQAKLTYVYCKAESPGIGAPNRGSRIKEHSIVLNRQLGS